MNDAFDWQSFYRQGWPSALGWAFVLILVNAYVAYPYFAGVPFTVLFGEWREIVLPIIGGGLGLRLTKAAETMAATRAERDYRYWLANRPSDGGAPGSVHA